MLILYNGHVDFEQRLGQVDPRRRPCSEFLQEGLMSLSDFLMVQRWQESGLLATKGRRSHVRYQDIIERVCETRTPLWTHTTAVFTEGSQVFFLQVCAT
jgi:hypothetical protein